MLASKWIPQGETKQNKTKLPLLTIHQTLCWETDKCALISSPTRHSLVLFCGRRNKQRGDPADSGGIGIRSHATQEPKLYSSHLPVYCVSPNSSFFFFLIQYSSSHFYPVLKTGVKNSPLLQASLSPQTKAQAENKVLKLSQQGKDLVKETWQLLSSK